MPSARVFRSLLVLCLAAAPVATLARAEIAPEAKPVLERYLAAIGGRATFEGTHSTHMKASLTAFGLSGTTESWSIAPDHRASFTKVGPFSLREAFDGKVGWRTDPGGKVLVLDGKDLETARGSAWFENERFLAADQEGGKVAYEGTVKDSTGTYTVLEITPPAGRSRRLYFNPTTGLIDRTEAKQDQQTVINFSSDYRKVEGHLVPFKSVTTIVGMPQNSISVALDSIEFNVPIADSIFAAPALPPPPVTWLKTPGTARLPFHYRGRHIWLRASVNGGPPADFIYDTGASITVIDSAYAAQIGLKTEGAMQAQGAGSAGNASFSRLDSLKVISEDGDGVVLKDQKVGVLSVNGFLAPFFWRDCAGVLGFNFISQFINEIDFDDQVLTLREANHFNYQGKGERVPFALAGTVPAVRMSLDNKYEGIFRVDVGSNSTVDLHGPFVKQNHLDRLGGKSVEVTGGGFGGTFSSSLHRMKEVMIGPYTWNNPLVSFSGAQSGALTSEDYAGNIGNQILERFKCTFDYEHHDLYLEPGKNFDRPDRFSRVGAQLARYGDEVKAMQVLKGSPADKAGLRVGDVVVSINGKPTLDYDPDSLAKMFDEGEVGSKIEFELTRDGARKKITVTLKEII
jgi:hypothetical protein